MASRPPPLQLLSSLIGLAGIIGGFAKIFSVSERLCEARISSCRRKPLKSHKSIAASVSGCSPADGGDDTFISGINPLRAPVSPSAPHNASNIAADRSAVLVVSADGENFVSSANPMRGPPVPASAHRIAQPPVDRRASVVMTNEDGSSRTANRTLLIGDEGFISGMNPMRTTLGASSASRHGEIAHVASSDAHVSVELPSFRSAAASTSAASTTGSSRTGLSSRQCLPEMPAAVAFSQSSPIAVRRSRGQPQDDRRSSSASSRRLARATLALSNELPTVGPSGDAVARLAAQASESDMVGALKTRSVVPGVAASPSVGSGSGVAGDGDESW